MKVNTQDVQLLIKYGRKLAYYAQLKGASEYTDDKFGVISTSDKLEMWIRREADERPNEDNRVFYAVKYEDKLQGDNYLIMVFRPGRWPKYLQKVVGDQERFGIREIDDKDLFGEI